MQKIMDGNEACSYVAYNFTEVAGIYPITPASPMAENVDKYASEGKKNFWGNVVDVVQMESEAGAAGMVHGSLISGILTSTFTASQGLLLMIPNMYKIAGEMLPGVINVAARSLATHALSIFGDHQDIYATRQTGFAILAESSVQQVMDLTSVAYLSAIESSLPFINFFDGFRTSHELDKVDLIDLDKVKGLINEKKLEEFRSRGLNPLHPNIHGTNQNGDIYFQATEVRNRYYDALPDTVNKYMKKINEITHKDYAPFNYYGSSCATKVIIAMGSVCETIRETVDYINKNTKEEVGMIEVHLYRPFSDKYLLKVLPKTVKKVAVLDRTKEAGSYGEPLYLDVTRVFKEQNINVAVYGGRYGLSSFNTTAGMIKGVFDFISTRNAHSNFTVGIVDDVTNLSIPYDKSFKISNDGYEFLIYGYGSDGMVSASKDIMKITGDNSNAYVQGYFNYDSKKSGGITISNLRFGKNPIHSSYYVEFADMVVCTKDNYLSKLNMLDKIKNNGIFIINTSKSDEELFKVLKENDKRILQNNNVKIYKIDANKIANEVGLPGKISSIMEVIIFKLGHLIDVNFAIEKIEKNLVEKFKNKAGDIAGKNIEAINRGIDQISEVKLPNGIYEIDLSTHKNFFKLTSSLEGENLPVSSFIECQDGGFRPATTKKEKRDIADFVPCYNSENCIGCNLCSLVCPHAAVRPFLLDENEQMDAPESLSSKLNPANMPDKMLKSTIGISIHDCTGCSLCSEVCPGKAGNKALNMVKKEEVDTKEINSETKYLFNEVKPKQIDNKNTIRLSQFVPPKFEFSGACAGCGETPYVKLLTQLFGDKLQIANATGCSSIYGASVPSMPYNVAWANSLFEDNAEFGYGMKIADNAMKKRICNVIENNKDLIKNSQKSIYNAYLEDINDNSSRALYDIVDERIEELYKLKDFILTRSFWIVGGDGWAYDIGYNGIDHVLANHQNVNILVLDTEVYSNTGGQASKSTKVGAIAKFAASGKKTPHKDLARIALSYDHVYVGTICLGANPQHAIKVLNEAEAYDGPSIIIAYAPCIAQGIIKGMKSANMEERLATQVGYFPLFHYNPVTKQFSLDSKADFSKYKEFLLGENRYYQLTKIQKDADELLEENLENAKKRYAYYESLVTDKV